MATLKIIIVPLFLSCLVASCAGLGDASSNQSRSLEKDICTPSATTTDKCTSTTIARNSDVQLTWNAPTQNTDNLRLDPPLEKYRIEWGTVDGGFTHCEKTPDASQTSYTIRPIEPGEYKFVVFAINSDDIESEPSNVACTMVP